MFEKLGPKKLIVPPLAVILIGCVMALMFTPMVKMSPQNLPFAILTLDEGVTTPQGEMNAGDLMVQNLTGESAAEGESPIEWHAVSSQAELDVALANNEYYGAITIPADFSQSQALAQAGEGEASPVEVVLDYGHSPMIATQMQGSIGTMFDQLNIPVTVQTIHTGSADTTSGSPLSGMMGLQLSVTPLMIMSLLSSILLTRVLPHRKEDSTSTKWATVGKQLAYAAVLSLIVSLVTLTLVNGLVGAGGPAMELTIFFWFASFMVMVLFLGAFNVAVPLGGLAVILVIFCGMMTGALPREVLPGFWADWIAPWVPQPMITQGFRELTYMESGLMPGGTGGLLIIGAAGLALIALSIFVPKHSTKSAEKQNSTVS